MNHEATLESYDLELNERSTRFNLLIQTWCVNYPLIITRRPTDRLAIYATNHITSPEDLHICPDLR